MITDDDMIQKMDAEEFTTMIDPFRNIQISLAGGGIASWMIVDQDQVHRPILYSYYKDSLGVISVALTVPRLKSCSPDKWLCPSSIMQ